jgi:autotransporter-associated beta strand protein
VFSSGATGATYGSTQININNGSTLRITGATGNQSIYDGRNYTFDASGGGSILVSTGNYNAVSTPFSITTNGGAQNTIGLITTSGTFGFNLGSTTCTFDVALGTDPSSDLTVTPIIANTGSVLKTGAGRLTFTGANTYSGGTTINGGTLRLVGGNAITGVVTLGDFAGATLKVVNSEGVNGISGGGAVGGTVSIDVSQVFSLVTGTHAYAGTISGAGRVANTGAVQTLSGALSQTGGVSVSGGTLTLGSSSNTYTGTTDISAATAGIVVTANGALGATGVGNETTVGANGVLGFSGGINYSAAEKVIGSGAGTAPAGFAAGSRGFIQSVSGNNTFAGDIELSANGNSRIGTQDGAQLTLTGAITQGTGITTGNILFRTGNLNNDFVTLSGTGNSFGGDSSVFNALATPGQYAGLRIGIDNAHPTNLTVQNFSSASGSSTALDLNGNDQALNGLASGGAGSLNVINLDTVNASTLTLNPTVDKNSGANIVILGGSPGGTALGDINLVKDGGFNQTLSGVNTYTGTTTINAGTLTINEGSIASSSGIANNAALVYNLTTNARTYANVISGSGTLTKSGTNTLTLSGANTYTGNTVVSAGTLALADNAQLKFVTGATSGTNNGISGAGTVTFDGDFVIDTTLTDASVLTTGTWTLVDASALAETFNPSFTILGAGWSETANVWTKTVGSKKYTFTEATGILALSSAASYASWIDGFGLTGPDALATADPDFDGIDNAVEMVIGGNPATGMDTALLPTIELVNADPDGDTTFTDYLLFTYRRSDLSVAAGVTADGETDTDLAGTWTAATGAPGVVIQVDNNFAFTPPAAADTDRVRVYVPRGANPALFGRLKVVVP